MQKIRTKSWIRDARVQRLSHLRCFKLLWSGIFCWQAVINLRLPYNIAYMWSCRNGPGSRIDFLASMKLPESNSCQLREALCIAQYNHNLPLMAKVLSSGWCWMKIKHCAVWNRNMTSGFSDYFDPDSSADRFFCITKLYVRTKTCRPSNVAFGIFSIYLFLQEFHHNHCISNHLLLLLHYAIITYW